MITINLAEILLSISHFAEDSYWFLCMCFWCLYFTCGHTLFHEISHVKAALRFGCHNHKVIVYDQYEESSFLFLGIPVTYTTKSNGFKLGKACYTPRNGLSEYEKYCITRAGFRYDITIFTIFFTSAEIAIYPAYYYGDTMIFWLLTAIITLCSFGYLGIQYFIKGTDLYKMRIYRAKEYVQFRESLAHQKITNWRVKRAEQKQKEGIVITLPPLECIVSNASSGITHD